MPASFTFDPAYVILFFVIILSIGFAIFNQPQHTHNPVKNLYEINVLPWALQILYTMATLAYSTTQSEIMVYLLHIPGLITSVYHVLHWHPFFSKRIRRLNEYIICAGIFVFGLVSSGTLVYHGKDTTNQIAEVAGGVTVIVSLIPVIAAMSIEKYRVVMGEKVKVKEVITSLIGFLNGVAWTAYGFYALNDWVISVVGIIWSVFGLGHTLLEAYGVYFHGGLETEDESDVDYENEDRVNSLNRAQSSASAGNGSTAIHRYLPRTPTPKENDTQFL